MLRLLVLMALVLQPTLALRAMVGPEAIVPALPTMASTDQPTAELAGEAAGCCPLCVPQAVDPCGCGCEADEPDRPARPTDEPRAPASGQPFRAAFASGSFPVVAAGADGTRARPVAWSPASLAPRAGPSAIPFLCRWVT